MTRLALLLGAALAACQPVAPAPPQPQPRRAIVLEPERGQPLPRLAGELLTPLMRLHADDLAAMRLARSRRDHDGVAAAARALLAEPRLARPTPSVPGTFNEALPATFFELQDLMLAAAREIERAASDHDVDAVERAYGELTTTCATCHDAYRTVRRRPR